MDTSKRIRTIMTQFLVDFHQNLMKFVRDTRFADSACLTSSQTSCFVLRIIVVHVELLQEITYSTLSIMEDAGDRVAKAPPAASIMLSVLQSGKLWISNSVQVRFRRLYQQTIALEGSLL